jgi:hypothetical protein
VADRGVAAEDLAATMLDDGLRADAAGGQQLLDERAGVFHFIFQCRGPEVRLGGCICAVNDQLPTQCHVTS